MFFDESRNVVFRFDARLDCSRLHPGKASETENALSQYIIENTRCKNEDPAGLRSMLQKVFATGEGRCIDFDFPGRGRVCCCEAQLVPEFDEIGGVESVLLIGREMHYRWIYEQTPAMLHSIDSEGVIVAVSDFWLKKLGYERGEVIGKKLWDFVSEASRREVEERCLPRFRETGRAEDVPVQYVRKDGGVLDTLVSATGRRNDNGKVVHSLCVSSDVSRRVRTEKELKSSEIRFNMLIQNAPLGIFVQTRGCFSYVNPETVRILGAGGPEQLLGRPIRDFVHRDFHRDILERIRATNEKLAPTPIAERKYLRVDGSAIDVEVFAVPIFYEESNGALVFFQDITERKRRGAALQESEEQFRRLFDQAPISYQSLDEKGCIIRVNAAWLKTLGYERGEVLGKWFGDFLAPSSRAGFRRRFSRMMNGDGIYGARMEALRADGGLIQIELAGRLAYDPHGGSKRSHCVFQDITERLTAERALEESKERYHTIFENNSSVMLLVDSGTGEICDANNSASRFYGYSREELTAKTVYDLNTLPRSEVEETTRAFSRESRGSFIFRHRLASGEIRDVEVYSGPVRIRGREMLYSIIHDITERVRMEAALLERKKELREKTQELEDINVTLNVMLKRGLKDRKELHENVVANMKEGVIPYLRKMKNSRLSDVQRTWLDILESNLEEITSPFSRQIAQRFSNLSPMEIQIAGFIKAGKRNKEISEILGISVNTVLTHRYHLREKLGLTGAKVNLQSYLNSMGF